MITILPATPELMARSPVGKPPWTVQAVVGVAEDGDVVGVAGVYPAQFRLVMFADMLPAMRADKRALVRGIRMLMGMVKPKRIPIQAVADPAIEGSATLLKHLGFEHRTGDVYQWLP